jgi:8-oxo-dGTP diphosphatase
MARAQCLIVRNNRILMTKHRYDGREWWCLPGGGIDKNETPETAAIRELKEECNVNGKITRMISYNNYSDENRDYTFLIDIDEQEPQIGFDPELVDSKQIIADMKWLSLKEIPERDRCFLWASGLIGVSNMVNEIEKWGDRISYPGEE